MNQFAARQARLIERSDSPTIPSNEAWLYAKSDGFLYVKNDIGEETQITDENGVIGGGGGGGTGISEFQFSPAEFFVESGQAPAVALKERFVSLPVDETIWTPWLKIPAEWYSLITGSDKLLLDIGAGAPGGGWSTLLLLAEYWLDNAGAGAEGIVYQGDSAAAGSSVELTDIEDGAGQGPWGSSPSSYWLGFINFTLNVTQGAVINAAMLTVDMGTSTGESEITVEGVKNSEYPTQASTEQATADYLEQIADYDRTTAVASIDPDGTGAQSISVDVADILQEIVNLPGWSSGGTVGILLSRPVGVDESISITGRTHTLAVSSSSVTEKEYSFSLADRINPKKSLAIGWDWTPNAGLFADATETWVRFRVKKKPAEGTIDDAIKVHFGRVAIGVPETEYGY